MYEIKKNSEIFRSIGGISRISTLFQSKLRMPNFCKIKVYIKNYYIKIFCIRW